VTRRFTHVLEREEAPSVGPLWAHTPKVGGTEAHPLETHLLAVAHLAATRAELHGLGGLAFWAGLLHDLGKARPGFQRYLRHCFEGRRGEPSPHAKWGAALAWMQMQGASPPVRSAIALSILGHHAGLPDQSEAESDLHCLARDHPDELERLRLWLSKLALDGSPKASCTRPSVYREEFAIRFVLSCLVDADRLDTARFYGDAPESEGPPLGTLWEKLEAAQSNLMEGLTEEARRSPVNEVRREVYEACLRAAQGPPGIYRLTVPTGGGKTRSSLAFALRHALLHGKKRVIVAIPYTSIIDQTAREYRRILGEDSVLEQHSQVVDEPARRVASTTSLEEDESPQTIRRRLAEENWDHPLIVTTTVQLFESLLTHRPSRARKVQSIAQSVIILDEVQTLPTEILEPTLSVVQTLVEEYGVTAVLCTATQPAFATTPFGVALGGTEINPRADSHFARLRRVTYGWDPQRQPWVEVGRWIASEPQGLAIVNSRRGAVRLAQEVLALTGERDSTFHLSTLLCSAHRRDVLEEVMTRLGKGLDVRLVSTQVVEAGVDVDFPVVWRALAPLDRVIQAAGRCNREGRLNRPGRVVLFDPVDESAPAGPYRTGMGLTRSLLERLQSTEPYLEEPARVEQYFRELYAELALENGFDKMGIQKLRGDWAFAQVGQKYRLIAEDTIPVVVDYLARGHAGRGPLRLREWDERPSRSTWRRLQPYVVTLRRRELKAADRSGEVTWISEGLALWRGEYDGMFGVPFDLRDPVDPVP
jgi:CRISPR-associated endonuclease/helicase Cas3